MKQTILKYCKQIPTPQAVYIFGSVTNNTTHSNSDIAFLAAKLFDNVVRVIMQKNMQQMVDLRNIAVNDYQILDIDIITNRLIYFTKLTRKLLDDK